MSEYTFAQIWVNNRIPIKDFRVSVFPKNHTVAVNEFLLPNNDYRNKFVSLSEKNKDWFPFFNNLDTANTVITDAFNVATNFGRSKGAQVVMSSILFKITKNEIWFVFKLDNTSGIPIYRHVGNLDTTPRQFLEKIHSFDYNPELMYSGGWMYPLQFNRNIPFPVGTSNFMAERALVDYLHLGRTDISKTSSLLFKILRDVFSTIYGHQVSSFKSNH